MPLSKKITTEKPLDVEYLNLCLNTLFSQKQTKHNQIQRLYHSL